MFFIIQRLCYAKQRDNKRGKSMKKDKKRFLIIIFTFGIIVFTFTNKTHAMGSIVSEFSSSSNQVAESSNGKILLYATIAVGAGVAIFIKKQRDERDD